MTFTDDIAAMRAVEARLAALFASDGTYGAKYDTYKGVDVVFINDESSAPEHIGKLMILLQGAGDDSQLSSAADNYRMITATATIKATDFNGAQVGAANPVSSDELLSIDLVKEIKSNWAEWNSLGLIDIDIQSGVMRDTEDANQTPIRETAHTIKFHYQIF